MLRINFTYLSIASLAKNFGQWLLLVMVAKVLGANEVSAFALAYAVSGPIFMFFNLQLKNIYVVDTSRKKYLFNYFLIRIVGAAIAATAILAYNWIGDKYSLTLLMVAMLKSVESITDIIHADYQRKELMAKMSNSVFLISIGSTISFGVAIYLSRNLDAGLLAMLLMNILLLVILDIRFLKINNEISFRKIRYIKRNLFSKPNLEFTKNLLFNAVPFGTAALLGSYLTNLPRIYVESYSTPEKLAYFSAMHYMAIGIGQLFVPVQTIIRPKLRKALQRSSLLDLKKIITKSICASLVGVLSIFLILENIGEWLVTKVYTKEYAGYIDILIILFASQGLMIISALFGIAITAFSIFRLQIITNALLLAIMIIIGPSMTALAGLSGAAYSILIISALSLIINYLIYKWKINLSFS
jgi:O-antigen/teichoic acid export membrane protein